MSIKKWADIVDTFNTELEGYGNEKKAKKTKQNRNVEIFFQTLHCTEFHNNLYKKWLVKSVKSDYSLTSLLHLKVREN